MPYIKPQDKPLLNPHIHALRTEIVAIAKKDPNDMATAFALLHYAGIRLEQEAALDATELSHGRRRLRYWIYALTDGVLMQVGRELIRKKKLPEPSEIQLYQFKKFFRSLPKYADVPKMNLLICDLVNKIMRIEIGYGYDAAFAGLCNYSLTTLGPGVVMDIYQKSDAGIARGAKRSLRIALLQKLAHFWWDTAQVLYNTEVARYEDQARDNNGEVEIYEEIDRWLEED